MSYLDLARNVVDQPTREGQKPTDDSPQVAPKPRSLAPEEEALICRVIETDQGLQADSVRLYTPQEFLELFGDKR